MDDTAYAVLTVSSHLQQISPTFLDTGAHLSRHLHTSYHRTQCMIHVYKSIRCRLRLQRRIRQQDRIMKRLQRKRKDSLSQAPSSLSLAQLSDDDQSTRVGTIADDQSSWMWQEDLPSDLDNLEAEDDEEERDEVGLSLFGGWLKDDEEDDEKYRDLTVLPSDDEEIELFMENVRVHIYALLLELHRDAPVSFWDSLNDSIQDRRLSTLARSMFSYLYLHVTSLYLHAFHTLTSHYATAKMTRHLSIDLLGLYREALCSVAWMDRLCHSFVCIYGPLWRERHKQWRQHIRARQRLQSAGARIAAAMQKTALLVSSPAAQRPISPVEEADEDDEWRPSIPALDQILQLPLETETDENEWIESAPNTESSPLPLPLPENSSVQEMGAAWWQHMHSLVRHFCGPDWSPAAVHLACKTAAVTAVTVVTLFAIAWIRRR